MNIRFRYRSRIPRLLGPSIRAVTVYPWILFREAKANVPLIDFRHELEHVYQVRRMGWLRFYASYLWLKIRGVHPHPYEQEARDVENTPLTELERKWWAQS